MRQVALKRICHLVTDPGPDQQRPFVALEHVIGGTGALVKEVELPQRTPSAGIAAVNPGDVLFGKLRPYLAKTFRVNEPMFASTELMAFRPEPGIDSRWLHYLIMSDRIIDWAVATSDGSKMPRTSWSVLGEYRVTVPDSPSQRAIADFLDVETARIDALIAKKRRLVEILSERVETAIEQLTWQISGSERLQLRRAVARFVDYRGATPTKANEGVPLATAAHIANGFIDLSREPQFLSRDTYIEWMRRGWPERDDIVMTTEAPLGEVAHIVDAKVALAQRVILLKCDASLADPTFLAYCLRARSFQDHLKAHATGSTALGIKAERLRALTVPIPSLKVQRTSIAVLKAMEERNLRLRSRLVTQNQSLAERRQALIAAAVTGQLKVPGAAA